MGATRLPGKPLKEIGGVPLIHRTYDQVASLFTHVVIATDSEDILTYCKAHKLPVVQTGSHHINGTTRMLEAYQHIGKSFEYVINVQGDEPFISETQLGPLCTLLQEHLPEAATLMAPVSTEDSTSNVYVTTDLQQRALLFSRSPIPANHHSTSLQRFQHIGVYAYRPEALERYCALSPTPLEQAESLEQLRWMEHGFHWHVATAQSKPLSIDTPQDLALAESLLQQS
ncbi:MAG: 3-deoxy-manno-octulosonate cytidylyltransferase [Cryomorphaceae bacterium]|nr:MAG: 3-deoxy-manno-octulosonate cytidylyltransferase [Cryomorphaceae bacterium]